MYLDLSFLGVFKSIKSNLCVNDKTIEIVFELLMFRNFNVCRSVKIMYGTSKYQIVIFLW